MRPIYRKKRPRTPDGHKRLVARLEANQQTSVIAAEAKRQRKRARNLALAHSGYESSARGLS